MRNAAINKAAKPAEVAALPEVVEGGEDDQEGEESDEVADDPEDGGLCFSQHVTTYCLSKDSTLN